MEKQNARTLSCVCATGLSVTARLESKDTASPLPSTSAWLFTWPLMHKLEHHQCDKTPLFNKQFHMFIQFYTFILLLIIYRGKKETKYVYVLYIHILIYALLFNLFTYLFINISDFNKRTNKSSIIRIEQLLKKKSNAVPLKDP